MSQAATDPGTIPSAKGVIALIREIQSGALSGRNLPPDDRRRCVEHLVAEGYSTVEVAEILGVAERTIARDRAAIREANALNAGPQFAGEMAGQLLRQAESGLARLRRLSRERECPYDARVDAERVAWHIMRELIQTLQRLGYMPEAPRELRASLHHQIGAADVQPPSFDALLAEVDQLESLCRASHPGDQDLLARLEQARRAVAGYGAAHTLAAIAAQIRTDEDAPKRLPPGKEDDQ